MSKRAINTLLLVEDNHGDARLLREMLNEQTINTIEVLHFERLYDAELSLKEGMVDIILLDLGLPDAQGLEAVRRARIAAPHTPLVVLTGLDDESLATQALQQGAQDYLIKGEIETRGLLRALRYAIERKVMEDALFVEKERAEVTLNCIGDAVVCTDSSNNITFINRAAETMVGWSLQEVFGHPIAMVFPIAGSPTLPSVLNPETLSPQNRLQHLSSSLVLIRKDGLEVPIEESISPIQDRNGNGTGAVIVFRDVRENRTMALQMVHLAEHDYLTNLPNRMLLNDRVGQAIALAARNSKHVALLFLDMDGFKHVNDSLGHSVGDKLLQSISKRLVDSVRASDTVSRQGGDEFVVLISEIKHPDVTALVAKKLLDAVAESHMIDHHDLHLTTSIGVSVYPDDGFDAETLIKNADTAMYQAKASGRHSYRFFTPEMNVLAVERQYIEEALRRALERKEFELYFQPKVNIQTGKITGAEALLRWSHPARGLISPVQFIPVAEECGIIVPVGRWVLQQACNQASKWLHEGLPEISIAVNISAIEFRQERFLEYVFNTLEQTHLPPNLLELELTESVLIRHADSTESILKSLRERGVQVAIDDFGTGYSSLSYLERFPIDALKIDQSFVRQITGSPEKCNIVSAIIGIGQSLNLRIIAEGVETQKELAFLQDRRCDEAQGYFFSKPVPADQFAQLLSNGIPSLLHQSSPSEPATAIH